VAAPAAAVSRLDPGRGPPALVARCATAAARSHRGDGVRAEVGLGVQAEITGSLGGEQHVAEVAAGRQEDLIGEGDVLAAGLGVPGSQVAGLAGRGCHRGGW